MLMQGETEPIYVKEPGQQLPPGTTFAEAFGLNFSDKSRADLESTMEQIAENERRAAVIGRNIIIKT